MNIVWRPNRRAMKRKQRVKMGHRIVSLVRALKLTSHFGAERRSISCIAEPHSWSNKIPKLLWRGVPMTEIRKVRSINPGRQDMLRLKFDVNLIRLCCRSSWQLRKISLGRTFPRYIGTTCKTRPSSLRLSTVTTSISHKLRVRQGALCQ